MFFANGAVFATWASRIPAITSRLEMGSAALSLAVFGLSAGSVLGLPLAGMLISRFGSRTVIQVALVGYAAALAVVGAASSVTVLTLALIGLGFGNGVLDVAMNDVAVRVERCYGRPLMASFHALFSFGGLTGALAGAAAAGLDMPTRWHLPVVAAVLLVAGELAAMGIAAPPSTAMAQAAAEESRRSSAPSVWRDRRLLTFGFLVFCSLLCEGAVYDWGAVYLQDSLGASPAVAALGFAAFTLAMAGSRTVADRIAGRTGTLQYIAAVGTLAAASMALTLFTPAPLGAVAGFGLFGLFLGGVVPMLFSEAARGYHKPAPAIASVSTIGYLGFLVGPLLVGVVATAASLRAALLTLVVLPVVIATLAGSRWLRSAGPAGQIGQDSRR